jgi:hypothetical protein
VQYGLTAWTALLTFFLAARYVMVKGPWIAAGAIGAAAYLLAGGELSRFELLMVHQEYGPSLVLGLAGLLLLDRAADRGSWPTAALGGFCVLLASWVNMAVFATLLPIALTSNLIRWAQDRPPRDATQGAPSRPALARRVRSALRSATAGQVAAFVASAAALCVLSGAARHRGGYQIDPMSEWGYTWLRLWQNACAPVCGTGWLPGARYISPAGWLATGSLVVLCAAGVCLTKSRKDALLAGLAAAAPLLAGALGNSLLIASLNWPRVMGYSVRYLIPSFMLLFLAAGAFSSAVVLRGLGPKAARIVNWLAVGALAAVIMVIYPAPSLVKVRSALDSSTGSLTQEVLAAKCTHIMGNYWKVWPGVFHANLVNYERGRRTIIWGIANRAGPTRDLWFNVPLDQIRVAEPIGDEEDFQWAQKTYRTWPLAKESQSAKITIYRPAQLVPDGQPVGAQTDALKHQ